MCYGACSAFDEIAEVQREPWLGSLECCSSQELWQKGVAHVNKIFIVIPFYNGDKYIDACLMSLSQGSCAKAEKIIVNNSDRGTQVHGIAAAYENVTVVDTKPRLGFGRACNTGAKVSLERGAEYIVFFNQDCVAHEALISELLTPLKECTEVGLTAPIPYNYDFSSIESQFTHHYARLCPELIYDALNGQIKDRYELDFVSGACIALKADFISRYGLFDPIFFMYGEDNDLCRRIKSLGYQIVLAPRACVGHHNQANVKDRSYLIRQSSSIYEMKDVGVPLPKALFRLFCRHAGDYPSPILSLRISEVFRLLAVDTSLVVSIPRIMRSRTAEKSLLSKHASLGDSPTLSHHGSCGSKQSAATAGDAIRAKSQFGI
jgi:GT2 family glycosyltransferase